MRDVVIQAYEMILRVWSKRGAKISASQHSTECVANGFVRTFAGTVLMRRVGPGELDLISEIYECLADLVTFIKFATTVHTYILVVTWGALLASHWFNHSMGGCFRGKGTAKETTTVVVGDKNITGLTVETDQGVNASGRCFSVP
jgi:hypothetical protein